MKHFTLLLLLLCAISVRVSAQYDPCGELRVAMLTADRLVFEGKLDEALTKLNKFKADPEMKNCPEMKDGILDFKINDVKERIAKRDGQNQPQQTNTTPTTSVSTLDPIIQNLINNMVHVEGGTFTMGATSEQGSDAFNSEKPAHQVTLSSFSIGRYEVTQEEWVAVMGSNPSEFKGAKRPVEEVSWNDCQEFIRKLNAKTGMTFRLPTEAEWEYAARGGNKSKHYKYAGGNDIDAVAWYDKNSFDKGESSPDYGTHPVGKKSPNELGLYDMAGNVYEWCQDWYDNNYYSNSPKSNPCNTTAASSRVYRGGSWFNYARYCRVAFRSSNTPDNRIFNIGLRLAR